MDNSFKANFIKLFSGTVIGQFLPIIVTPFLTRLYSPGEIGNFAFYYSFIAIFTGVVNLKMDQALIISKSEYEVIRLYKLCNKLAGTLSAIVLLVILSSWIVFMIIIDGTFPFWWFLLPIHIFIIGRVQSRIYFLNRKGKYGVMGKSKVVNGIVFALIQLALFQFDEYGLILGAFIGALVNSIFLKRHISKDKDISGELYSPFFTKTDWLLIKKYKDFPIYSSSIGILNSTSNNIPTLVLGELFKYEVTGFYSWANRIIQTPMGFILSTLQQIFYQSAADKHKEGKSLYPVVISMLNKLFLIGIVPYTIVFIFSQQIFGFVFGAEWIEAGKYTQVLVPWFFLMFLSSPISSIIIILNQQKKYFVYEIILFVLRFLALFSGYYFFNDAYYSILFYGIVGALYNIFLLRYVINISKYGGN